MTEVTIVEPERLSAPIELHEYDPAWPAACDDEAAHITRDHGRATLAASRD
jgi:GrpB-like predicted nucleotidyltransferase (UPF0157 family)